ncbi:MULTISPECIES: restriction endonuclease subunit S [Lactiplantibacillus]|jgi:type I restriction enzyme S subunit|uniref:restriction endonuclease subunit S n=1 Tax=Lactiplantibacillus TaxID=2767842 RepID=UPI00073A571D|nr:MULTISPECIES: restriction endonuclease subunit S [Lactiplantibacillus]MCV3762534.1 restriction endonuclease subunit S [Companilactobacillus farciminis]ALV15506.1 hypothetical protein AD081_12180 [Lactiplantibacillus plantarum]AYA97649.1 restriction endonuclease subunit S [Lactiplantibacillus plantarum]AYG34026.1 restriction endonuclease subunit S [Lactiplantibacillus plantarum]MCG0797347.1 restriction endonuclease subunit S [Lactiplantibacillus plantarum]
MKNENLVPKVRFKGFSDPWEQRKLGDITAITMGQSPSSANYTNNPEDHILVQGNADMKNGYVLPRVWTTQITKKAEAGDLILSVRAPVGDIGKTDYDVVLGRGVASIKGNEFIYQTLKYMNDIGKWTRFSTGSTFESINSADIKDARIGYPKLNEQNLIGNILEKMDSIIAANEDKLEQLKTLKKLMMQKIFSQEWRFKGFTDPWEQRKLKWFLRVSKLKNIDGIFDKNSVLSVSGEFGVVNQIAFQGRSFAGKSILNYGILDHNDVVYTKSPLKSNPYGIIKTNLGKAGVVSTLYAVYAPLKTVYSPILGYYFNLDTRVNNYLRPLVNKGAKNDMKVRDEAVLEGKVCIPDSIETQKRICNLFSLIDNLIAANEDKLNQLKELKKYLMQNMFV